MPCDVQERVKIRKRDKLLNIYPVLHQFNSMETMETDNITVKVLHENYNLLQSCIILLNNEWPRSEVARMRSIEKSNPQLPTSIMLVRESKSEVIGHAKVARMHLDQENCWIESVVVHPSYRGLGFGKLLMDACEKLAIQLGFSSAVLSTHDKQTFYEKLGYKLCDCSFPYAFKQSTPTENISGLSQSGNIKPLVNSTLEMTNDGIEGGNPTTYKKPTVPPPPPLLPKALPNPQQTKSYMRKPLK